MHSTEGRVRLERVSKRFGDVHAVEEVDLEIPPGSFFALLGPSGCGKSTLLRMIAGLEEPSSGSILVDGVDITGLAAQKRPTAMVFQSYALFPSMTVGENVEYGLRVRRVSSAERTSRTAAALARVGMEALADRPVTALSGGQQQRVALARALVVEPAVMLFDEPLSNLDVALRERTRGELRRLQKSLGTTSVYVTHDQQEAMAVADLMAVMREGRLVQMGSPAELYHEPATAYVAQFLGGSNIVRDPGLALRLTGEQPPAGRVLSIRPEDFEPASEGALAVRVTGRQFLGPQVEWDVEVEGTPLRLRLPSSLTLTEHPTLAVRHHRWVADDAS